MNNHWFYIQRWNKARSVREAEQKRLNKNQSQTSNNKEKE